MIFAVIFSLCGGFIIGFIIGTSIHYLGEIEKSIEQN